MQEYINPRYDYSEGDENDVVELNQDAKHPSVVVKLVGEDGNSFAIMGRVAKALKRGGVPQTEVDQFYAECQASHSQTEMLIVVMKWVAVQ